MDPITKIDSRREAHWRDGEIAPARGALVGLVLGACAWIAVAVCWKLLL